jgi:hypothetical protein
MTPQEVNDFVLPSMIYNVAMETHHSHTKKCLILFNLKPGRAPRREWCNSYGTNQCYGDGCMTCDPRLDDPNYESENDSEDEQSVQSEQLDESDNDQSVQSDNDQSGQSDNDQSVQSEQNGSVKDDADLADSISSDSNVSSVTTDTIVNIPTYLEEIVNTIRLSQNAMSHCQQISKEMSDHLSDVHPTRYIEHYKRFLQRRTMQEIIENMDLIQSTLTMCADHITDIHSYMNKDSDNNDTDSTNTSHITEQHNETSGEV